MNIEKRILEIYEEINKSKKILSNLNEAALISPVDNTSVNSGFGARWGKTHNGVDLKADAAEVKAPADGVVDIAAIKQDDCGGTITINHADGYKTGFCHLQKIIVTPGQEVKQGDVIGISGGGANDIGHGRSDGRHLHFTLRKDGNLLNPMDYIDKDSITMSGEPPKSSGTMSASEKAYAAATSSSNTSSKTSYGQLLQNLKSLDGLNEMISSKNEFKDFLLNEVESSSDKLFGGSDVKIPAAGGHGGQSGWQSGNAWDIMTQIGTPVYAVADGTLRTFHDYGATPIHKDGKTLFGQSFTVDNEGGLPAVYYTHLKDVTVQKGDKIKCGQLIGYVMDFPDSDSDHLHIGVESGDVSQFLNPDGTLKCAKGQTISGTTAQGGSTSKSSSFTSSATVPGRDEFVYNTAKKIGDIFLPKESIEEQRNFGKGIQNRYGKIIIPKDSNPKIKSPISGVVDNSRFSSSCKNQVTIKNTDNGKIYLQFCGMDTPLVRDGMSVSEGQIIGKTDSDVDVTLYDSSWNRLYIKDTFEVKKSESKDETSDKDKKKSSKERYYSDPAVALMASLPGMAFDKIFGNRYDKKTGELKQKRWGSATDKREVDPWVIDFIKKPFTKKVNEDIEKIKKLLK